MQAVLGGSDVGNVLLTCSIMIGILGNGSGSSISIGIGRSNSAGSSAEIIKGSSISIAIDGYSPASSTLSLS